MRKPAIQMAPIFANRRVPSMATISRAKATLRIMGDSLIPEEVTSVLGGTPREAQRKGQALRGQTGISRTAKFGMWRLRATGTAPGDLDAQVQEILSQLTDDIAVWNRLASQYDIDRYCGWFMEKEGFQRTAQSGHKPPMEGANCPPVSRRSRRKVRCADQGVPF
jgi:hypothetical protein